MQAERADVDAGSSLPLPPRAAIRQIVDWSAKSTIRWSPPVEPDALAPLLIAVHGYGQSPDAIWAFAAPMAPLTAWVVVPEGPSTFYRRPRPQGSSKSGIGHGWVADPQRDLTDARNDALLKAAVAGAHTIAPVDPARTWIVAYSQGVGVAVHFALEYPHLVAGIVALAGGIPLAQRDKLRLLAGKQLLWITGSRDSSYPPDYSEAVRTALTDAGVDLDVHILDAAHDLLASAQEVVRAWLHPRLQ